MKKITIIIGLLVIGVALTIFTGSLSVIGGENQEFSECKIVLEENQCDVYSKCVYDSERDASCMKTGYERLSIEQTPDIKKDFNGIGAIGGTN